YPSDWAWSVQPQGQDFSYFRLVFEAYRGLRKLGLSVDVIPAEADIAPYKLVLAPGLMTLPDSLRDALAGFDGIAILGPRAGARSADMAIPVPLPPGLPGLEAVVALVESLPPDLALPVKGGGTVRHWMERIEGSAPVLMETEAGAPVLLGDRLRYLAGWPDPALWARILQEA
ncbi:MAG: beta-galactosidase trimerization domain-containing protein, partial [Pseudomonadota bacterium]